MNGSAFSIARDALLRKDPANIAIDSGARIDKDGIISVRYFSADVSVSLSECLFAPDIPWIEKVLVLKYLSGKIDDNISGEWVSYGNLPAGMFYNRTFERRGQERIRKTFENRGGALVEAARMLGGVPESFRDVSARIPVFPRIDVLVTLSFGDEEFGSDAKILFRKNIASIFSLEEIAFLGDTIARRLCAFIR